MEISPLAATAAASYLSGSIPFGLIVARVTGGPDPRAVGSGRLGGTNSLRALGRRRAAVVSAGDVLKGYLPVAAVAAAGGSGELQVVAALCAVVGATRSIWVGFKGGRGIATGFGTALAIAPLPLLAASPVFFAVILATRLVSAGSLAAAAAFAPLMIGSRLLSPEGLSLADAAYAIVGPALVWVAHADNIARLREGTERRFDLGLLRRD